jgi:hypothetical protein
MNPPKTPGYTAPSPIERRPSSPRKTSAGNLERQPSPSTPTIDPTLKQLTSQITQMQEDLRKRDAIIQELCRTVKSPTPADDLAAAKREIEKLKESTSELKRGQEELVAMSTPERQGGSVSGSHRVVREKVGKWQEYLETPISVSQRRSRRDTPRQSRYVVAEVGC